MKNHKNSKMAKILLAEYEVKIFQKDVKNVIITNEKVVKHKLAGGAIAPDYFPHRQIISIEMKSGTVYVLKRETVDKQGNYSEESALWKTKDFVIA